MALNIHLITLIIKNLCRSLYDNKINVLENGTFDGLVSLQTLHLARNPFHCDCRLSWMVEWMRLNPVETSGARCEGPKKLHKRKLATLQTDQMKCYGMLSTSGSGMTLSNRSVSPCSQRPRGRQNRGLSRGHKLPRRLLLRGWNSGLFAQEFER